jgi:hypothetical protein
MPKATKHSTRKAKRAAKRASEKRPRRGLAFINAAYQRKSAPEPNLKRELKMRKHPNDVGSLVALYDSYMAAVGAMMGVANQPRATGGDDVIWAELNYLIAKAWTVAEHLKDLRPTASIDREQFVRLLVDCAFEMGGNVDDAASVLRDAVLVGTADERDFARKRAAA